MKKSDLKQWEQLYNLTLQIYDLAPWNVFGDIAILSIKTDDQSEEKYLSFMGNQCEEKGISVYSGLDGYSDNCQMYNENLKVSTEFLLSDQNCLMVYWTDEKDIDQDTQEIMKALGIDDSIEKNCVYFRSFEKRFFPINLNMDEVNELIQVYEGLLKTLQIINEENITWDEDEMLCASKDGEDWMIYSSPYPIEEYWRYPIIRFEQTVIDQLKQLPKNDLELAVDLNYLFVPIFDEEYEKPLNPLAFLFYDLKTDQVIGFDLIRPDEDAGDIMMDVFLEFIQQEGCPNRIYARNPYVMHWFSELCDELGIELVIDEIEEVDELYEGLQELAFADLSDFNS